MLSMSTKHLPKIISNDENIIEIESIKILKTVRNFSKVILCSNIYKIIWDMNFYSLRDVWNVSIACCSSVMGFLS